MLRDGENSKQELLQHVNAYLYHVLHLLSCRMDGAISVPSSHRHVLLSVRWLLDPFREPQVVLAAAQI